MKKIFADFNNVDKERRVRLNAFGSFESIKNESIELYDGLEILIDDDDSLKTIGILHFSNEENLWTAKIDWNKIEHY